MTTEIKPCPFCGGTDFVFTESEDDGFIFCNGCWGSTSIPLESLPGYHEANAILDDCSDETKQPLIDKWNTRV